jgi:hypothetical protein
MKNIIVHFLILMSIGVYSEEYYFNRKLVSVKYSDSNGNKKQNTISKIDNSYRIVFEKAAEQKNSPIIQIYNDNEEKGYYAFVQKYENPEIGGGRSIYMNVIYFFNRKEKWCYNLCCIRQIPFLSNLPR